MDHYSSCLDEAFLPRGLALYRSLLRHAGAFRLWVLCFDEASYGVLTELGLKQIIPIKEDDLIDDDLRRVRAKRSRREYYFASKPWLNRHVLEREPSADRITFLDGDLYFFSDTGDMQAEIARGSIGLSPHRSGRKRHDDLFGIYNAGLCSFAGDEIGIAALTWWRKRCLEASPDYPIGGLFTDQKYLEQLPRLFQRVVTLTSKGVNLAPWNIRTSEPFEERAETVTAAGDRIVVFHFHGVTKLAPGLYDPGWKPRGSAKLLRDRLYRPYLSELEASERLVEAMLGSRPRSPAPWGASRPRPRWWRGARTAVAALQGRASGRLISVPRTFVVSDDG